MPTDVPKISSRKIGKYKRSYDEIVVSDVDDSQEETEEERILDEVLAWTNENRQENLYDYVKHSHQDLAKSGVRALRAPPSTDLSESTVDILVERAIALLKDIYFATRDILAGKKVRTALTILAGIGIGAAAGAAIGTLAMPVIGTAGGAVLGAISGVLATVVPLIGGTVGLTILGAFAGGAIARFASERIYKNERRFGLSKRITSKIKSRSGVKSKTAELINGYLYNRAKTAKDPALQKLYKDLRKYGIHYADPQVMEMTARFFCHELTLLQREIDPDHHDVELQEEIAAVVHILESLKVSNTFPRATKRKIRETLNTYHAKVSDEQKTVMQRSVAPPLQGVSPLQKKTVQFSHGIPEKHGVRYENMVQFDQSQLDNVNQKFQAILNQPPYHDKVREVKVKPQRKEHDNLIEFRCRLEGEQKVKIIFHQEEVAPSTYATGVYVEKSKLKKENQEMVSDLLLKGVEVLQSVNLQSAPQQILTVDADGDDVLAIQLMAAALRAKLPVQLNDLEYPDTPEMQPRRSRIEKEARRLAVTPETIKKVKPPRPKRPGLDTPT